ncbi:hypothetical protein EYF80_048676 [Liparis tanakae]|uniref:Uncharacterized protein n=1 Tax=Liparis tanakae TaxID=230148 RepID=A0A4Z2FJM4_9TELE|nr:hypothetical protein EYF80_048676 [Liparis tanakae]
MVWNFSDLCAAVSALITLARRKLRKVSGSRKVTPLGMGGPKGGTTGLRLGMRSGRRSRAPTCCGLLGMYGSMVDTWNMTS